MTGFNSSFNPLQIITKIANTAVQNNGSKGFNNTLGAGFGAGVNNIFQNLQTQNSESLGSKSNQGQIHTPSFFKPTPFGLNLASEQRLTTIEIDKKASYVKDLLGIPREFNELLDELVLTKANGSSMVSMENEALMVLKNAKIDISMLSILLGENSKAAMQKLMMAIANAAKCGANDVSGLKELLGLFSSNSAMMSENQVLKTVILLYLPWLPLSARNEDNLDFTIDIFDKIQGPDPDSEENTEAVTILIQTKNFSNVTAALEINPLGQVDVDVAAEKDFPHKRVMELIKEAASLNNVTSNVSANISKIAAKQDFDYKSNVKIMAKGAISQKLMLMAHSLIKIIIELDFEKTVINKQNDGSNSDKDE